MALAPVDTSIFVPAPDFEGSRGTPSRAIFGTTSLASVPCYLLDPDAVEAINALVRLPASWSTFHMDVWWGNPVSSVGNVRLRADRGTIAPNAALPTNTAGALSTFPAPAQHNHRMDRLLTGAAVPAAGSLQMVSVLRNATDAVEDTLTNDIAVLGILLTMAS